MTTILPPLPLTPVEPIGTETVHTLHGDFEVPVYPPAPPEAKRLRDTRRSLGLYLTRASEALGCTVAEASSLEHGFYTTDWDEAERRLRDYALEGAR